MNLKKAAVLLGLTAMASGVAVSQEDDHHIPSLDHVFVIMMENHYIGQVLGQTFTPFTNSYAASANLAKNYWAVGHPSLTNYLEIVGGSNFGIVNDNPPDWHATNCVSTLSVPVNESTSPAITCPIAGSGMDAATPAVDTTNEGTPTEPIYNIPFAPAKTVGISIADQLVEHGMSWKSYQEDLPPYGADGVNASDGLVSNTTQSEPGMPQLYAVKHNPFAYFASVQGGTTPGLSLKQVVDFHQLYADLSSGNLPDLAFIAPNQCHDQHSRGSSEMGTGCSVDANAIAQGDAALSTLIAAIHGSPVWKSGRTAIVTVWDENDYSSLPNNVVAIVDTNYGTHGQTSNVMYNHFSLLKTLEDGFGLPPINHAADHNVRVMSDLFSAH
jgi:phosphatidylinositol-3-phosphatase